MVTARRQINKFVRGDKAKRAKSSFFLKVSPRQKSVCHWFTTVCMIWRLPVWIENWQLASSFPWKERYTSCTLNIQRWYLPLAIEIVPITDPRRLDAWVIYGPNQPSLSLCPICVKTLFVNFDVIHTALQFQNHAPAFYFELDHTGGSRHDSGYVNRLRICEGKSSDRRRQLSSWWFHFRNRSSCFPKEPRAQVVS